jgi:hypothetical protein
MRIAIAAVTGGVILFIWSAIAHLTSGAPRGVAVEVDMPAQT